MLGQRALTGQEPVVLTPQELEIAHLAASGLTSEQIAVRLYRSPRTVGGHLGRIFPELAITSRAALRDALLDLDRPWPHTSTADAATQDRPRRSGGLHGRARDRAPRSKGRNR